MKLTYSQISDAYDIIKELSELKLPFRLSLLISKNLSLISKEYEFYLEQERKFVFEYLLIDKQTGNLVQTMPGVCKIQEGKEQECQKAREALDNFEVEMDIKKIPASMLEPFEFTPAQLAAIDFMIEEEEEHD